MATPGTLRATQGWSDHQTHAGRILCVRETRQPGVAIDEKLCDALWYFFNSLTLWLGRMVGTGGDHILVAAGRAEIEAEAQNAIRITIRGTACIICKPSSKGRPVMIAFCGSASP